MERERDSAREFSPKTKKALLSPVKTKDGASYGLAHAKKKRAENVNESTPLSTFNVRALSRREKKQKFFS